MDACAKCVAHELSLVTTAQHGRSQRRSLGFVFAIMSITVCQRAKGEVEDQGKKEMAGEVVVPAHRYILPK